MCDSLEGSTQWTHLVTCPFRFTGSFIQRVTFSLILALDQLCAMVVVVYWLLGIMFSIKFYVASSIRLFWLCLSCHGY